MLQSCIWRGARASHRCSATVESGGRLVVWCVPSKAARGVRFFHSTLPSSVPEEIVPLRKQLKDEAKAKRATASDKTPKFKSKDTNSRLADWELTVGIEIHAQLNTARKLFSAASTSINDVPNSHVALFDLAVPGSLPIFQKSILIPALRAALVLNCDIQQVSHFDRKHYFYHDQPSGYQITQYYEPFARNGFVKLTTHDGIHPDDGEEVTIGIKQVQMEQDTAKSQDAEDGISLLDFNRVGHPLIEIISLPQMHTPETAAAYVRKIQAMLFAIDAVTTGMEMGGLRADVNVSVRRRDGEPGPHQYSGIVGLGQRTEIKNLSTLKGVEDAIRAERDRQIDLLEAGGKVKGETRGWSLARPSETRRLRGKEGEVDYRYMPDPDIAPLIIGRDLIDHLVNTLPSTPDRLLAMLVEDDIYKLSLTDAKILIQLDGGERLDYYQDVVDILRKLQRDRDNSDQLSASGKTAANWVLQELGSLLSTSEVPWSENKVSKQSLADILDHLMRGNITGSTAKHILKLVFEGDSRSISDIIEENQLAFRPLSKEEYVALAEGVMNDHQDTVQQIRDKGQTGKIMFLVGQMMRRGEEGRVEAKKAEALLRQLVLTPSKDS